MSEQVEKKIIVIAGANGFIGKYISRHFQQLGWKVLGLVRRQDGLADGVEMVKWDGVTLESAWAERLDGADVLINLTGRTINCRHNTENKRQIMDSRIDSTRVLGEALLGCENPPEVWMNASASSIYKPTRKSRQTESGGEMGEDFMSEVAIKWEEAFFGAKVGDSVRKIALRTTLVMADEKGTVMDILSGLARKYLGGTLGDGGQMVSWIDIDDYCRAVEWMIKTDSSSGPYNLAAPHALTNEEMMKRVREKEGACFGLPAFEWMLEIGAFFMQTEAELMIGSSWVYPEKLLEEGFVFKREEF
ncbi:MAG: hypothetical protein ACI9E1_000735 [Cryomorphaceae bacterium]|jgi:uncharacterized protein (TIGR01777 family)